jgi:GT2 family glycosyltransferase
MSRVRFGSNRSEENSAPPVVTAMVVHQPGPWFDEVLQSLAKQDYSAVSHVFFLTSQVINQNADTSASQLLMKKIQTVLPESIVRIVEGNPGFGVLINEIQRIVEGSKGLFCVMHDDVLLEPSTISQLVHEMLVTNASIVGPKLVQWDNPTILKSVGLLIDRCGEVDPLIEANERDQEQHDSVKDVFFISSACMLIRADTFRELNGFCREISFFGEDLEFCWRTHLSGARVIFAPSAVVRHREMFAQRAPEISKDVLAARHRVRTVTTLTWRLELPLVWLQMLVTSVIETTFGVFNGNFRGSLANLRATISVFVDFAYVWGRRREVRKVRRVPASDISKMQVKGSARITKFIRHRRALESLSISSEAKSQKLWRQSSTREAGFALLVIFLLIVIGSRGIILGGSRTVGEFLPFEGGANSAGSLMRMFRSGWWSSGFGEAAANPTGLGLLALGGFFVLGNLALLETLMIVGSLFVGFFGMWRLCGSFYNTRARLVGATVYVALPLSYDAIARGRFSALLTVAALPWVFDLLRKVGGLLPNERKDSSTGVPLSNSENSTDVGISRLTQLISALVLILGLVAAFAPAILVIAFIGIILWCAASLFGRTSMRSLGTMFSVGIIGIFGALFVNLPWSMHYVSGRWWELLTSDQSLGERNLGLIALASLNFGEITGGTLVLASYFCVACSLLVANSWRFVWALRSSFLVAGGLLLAVLDDQGLLPFGMPEPVIILSLVACGLALASATCASVFSETSAKKTSDWRRSVGLLVPVAISVAILPSLLGVVDGRWHQPNATVSQLFAQMPDNPTDGNYRVLFVGDNELLPISTNAVTNKVSYGVSDDGPVNIVSHWAPQRTAMNELADHALNALIDRQTVRVGRLMSPLAIRFIVVPLGDQPSQSARLLVDSLSNQIDLRRLYFAKDLAIFENSAWLPIVSLLDEESAVASEKVDESALIVRELRSLLPLFIDDQSVANKTVSSAFDGGTVHLAVPFNKNWQLIVDDARLNPRVAFGASTAFDAPIKGVAKLSFRTSKLRDLYLVAQALVWLGLLMLAVNFSRFRRQVRSVSSQNVRLVADDSQKIIKLDRFSK